MRKKFTFKQKLALMSMALVDFMSFCAMSIMAPFFPQESFSKGMSETISGFVFSFYALVMFLSSPIFGKIVRMVFFSKNVNYDLVFLLLAPKNWRQSIIYWRDFIVWIMWSSFRVRYYYVI